jgi:hypothetical protein
MFVLFARKKYYPGARSTDGKMFGFPHPPETPKKND